MRRHDSVPSGLLRLHVAREIFEVHAFVALAPIEFHLASQTKRLPTDRSRGPVNRSRAIDACLQRSRGRPTPEVPEFDRQLGVKQEQFHLRTPGLYWLPSQPRFFPAPTEGCAHPRPTRCSCNNRCAHERGSWNGETEPPRMFRRLVSMSLAVTGVENYAAAAASDSTTPETSGVRAALSGPTA